MSVHKYNPSMPDSANAASFLIDCMREIGELMHRFVGRNRTIFDEGEHIAKLKVLCSGWAIRTIALDSERRQVLGVCLPGDILGFHRDSGHVSTCKTVALTACEIAELELHEVERVAKTNPEVGECLRYQLARELSHANDHLLRLGRMTAYERVCSFLLDIYTRQQPHSFHAASVAFPITQTVMADALGLSIVHVNRQIMRLRREQLVTLNRRELVVHDTKRLSEICGNRGAYLEVFPEVFSATAAE